MGFFFHAVKIRVPRTLTGAFFLSLWAHLRSLIVGALTHLGIYKPPPGDDNSSDTSNNYIFILDGSCPSPVPIPIHVVTAAIKRRVTVKRYRDFPPRLLAADLEEPESLGICTVCFEPIDLEHEVRELCRCAHVFHRDCLDTWVDSGQVSCPLCRSMLLPPKTNLSRCAGDPPPSNTAKVGSGDGLT